MLDSAQLTALAQILRLGSFEAAAAALGVTPSAVSQLLSLYTSDAADERSSLVHGGRLTISTEKR